MKLNHGFHVAALAVGFLLLVALAESVGVFDTWRANSLVQRRGGSVSMFSGGRFVDLGECEDLRDDDLRQLKYNQPLTLDISATSITDSGMISLSRIENLKFLNIARTRISKDAIKRFQKARPNCVLVAPDGKLVFSYYYQRINGRNEDFGE